MFIHIHVCNSNTVPINLSLEGVGEHRLCLKVHGAYVHEYMNMALCILKTWWIESQAKDSNDKHPYM